MVLDSSKNEKYNAVEDWLKIGQTLANNLK
jgi:hypothetical protein